MRSHVAVALLLSAALAAQAPAARGTFVGAWWSGVKYHKGQFEPAKPATGRPGLVERTYWRAEKTEKGVLIRVNKAEYGKGWFGFHPAGYLTADENGVVGASPKPGPGSYWVMKKVKTERGYYDKPKEDWKGKWSRTAYTLEPAAEGLRGGKLGFRGGKLTVHPKNKGLAILSETYVHAEQISGP